MIQELGWIRGVVTGRFVLRAGIYGLAAILLALVAAPAGRLLPGEVATWVDETSIRDLLEVIASSMLLVATFSLGTMVAAYTAATQSASPRATRVLIEDPVSQTVIATFVGAFVFATIGLVALSLGVYGEAGRVLLLIATIFVVVLVILTLFGWIDYLANLVRLGAVLNKVEAVAGEALCGGGAPVLACRRLGSAPPGGHAIRPGQVGYVTTIDLARLDRSAAEHAGTIRIVALPGTLVGRDTPAAFADFAPGPDEAQALVRAFTVAADRSIEQDPRFGLVVLSEVASRALSTGVNDPGTAISVISRLQRLLSRWADHEEGREEIRFPHVEAPAVPADDLLQDAFGPLARDAAPNVEVGIRLQKALAALAGLGDPDLAAAALRQSERAREQAEAKLVLESDREEIRRLARAVRMAAEGPA